VKSKMTKCGTCKYLSSSAFGLLDVTDEQLELVVGSRRKGTPTNLPTYYLGMMFISKKLRILF